MTELRLDFVDNNKSVRARVGDIIVITIPENATTGFQWGVASITEDTLVSLPEDTLALDGNMTSAPVGTIGAGEAEVTFRFGVTSAGHGNVTLKLSRGSQSDDSAFKFMVNIDISQ